jgi:urease accessory protein
MTLKHVLVAAGTGIGAAVGATPLLAHTGTGDIGGLASGILHPLTGLDHVVAMVAVGLWGCILGGRAVWQLPVIFPLVMAFGGMLGIAQVPFPAVETGIALSGVVLGLLVALAIQLPATAAWVIVAAFALFHGYAHGAELPEAANPLAYAAGFVVATGLLHLAGIGLGQLWSRPAGKMVVRAAGSVIALAGLAFLTGVA